MCEHVNKELAGRSAHALWRHARNARVQKRRDPDETRDQRGRPQPGIDPRETDGTPHRLDKEKAGSWIGVQGQRPGRRRSREDQQTGRRGEAIKAGRHYREKTKGGQR